MHVLSKNAKIREVKMLKPLHYHSKLCSNILKNPRGSSLTPRAERTQKWQKLSKGLNIAGRLPENSHKSFVDLQSQKTVKKTDQKNSYFHWRLICSILIKNLYKLLLPLLTAL